MARGRDFRIVVATDGSPTARAGVALAVAFPWPSRSRATGVVAREPVTSRWSPTIAMMLQEGVERVASHARAALRRRWPEAQVLVVDKPAVEAILAEGRGADAIVIGSRGHGLTGRLLLGSVSRGVVRRVRSPVLVVKGNPRRCQRFVVAYDGSAHAKRAAALVATLPPPRGGHVTLVTVVEPIRPRSVAMMPAGVRGVLAREVAAVNARQVRVARRALEAVARRLARAGWGVSTSVRSGVPLTELLAAVAAARADVIVTGARGTGGLELLLLGSVAHGLLTLASRPVLLVR